MFIAFDAHIACREFNKVLANVSGNTNPVAELGKYRSSLFVLQLALVNERIFIMNWRYWLKI